LGILYLLFYYAILHGHVLNCFVFKFKIGHLSELPKEIPAEAEKNEDFLRKAHHVLLEVNFVIARFAFC